MARVTQEHIDARRGQILRAAVQEFGSKGLDPSAATIDDVAAAAGLSKGSIYSYFKNKDELLRAISTAGVEADITAFQRSRERTASAWDAFWDISRRVWDSLLDPNSREAIMLSMDRMLSDVRAGSVDRRPVDVPVGALTEMLADAQREGRVAADIDARVLATALWNCQQGTRAYVLRTGDTETADAILGVLKDLLERTAASGGPALKQKAPAAAELRSPAAR